MTINSGSRPIHGGQRAARRWLVGAGVVIGVVALTSNVLPAPVSSLLAIRPAPSTLRLTADLEARASVAEGLVRQAQDFVRETKIAEGVVTDSLASPDPSGLIGAELTPLVTTLGILEAKQISTNAAWARELTVRLAGAGVRPGTAVAGGFSGSFPALNLAVMAACQALDTSLVAISSVTASTWGANQPGFTWPEVEARLVRANLIRQASVAVSTGGADDRARDLDPEGRVMAEWIRDAASSALRVTALRPSSLEASIGERLELYEREARGRPIVLYVNVGGTDPSLGTSAVVLRLRSGFLPGVPFDFSPGRGLIARFAEKGVPVLTLLNVRDLALRWGIPLQGRTLR